MKQINLTNKEYQIVEHIRKHGKWAVVNCQNPTVKSLIKKGVCEFNSLFDALILTKTGQEIEL